MGGGGAGRHRRHVRLSVAGREQLEPERAREAAERAAAEGADEGEAVGQQGVSRSETYAKVLF